MCDIVAARTSCRDSFLESEVEVVDVDSVGEDSVLKISSDDEANDIIEIGHEDDDRTSRGHVLVCEILGEGLAMESLAPVWGRTPTVRI